MVAIEAVCVVCGMGLCVSVFYLCVLRSPYKIEQKQKSKNRKWKESSSSFPLISLLCVVLFPAETLFSASLAYDFGCVCLPSIRFS